jgi:hypothetical protein
LMSASSVSSGISFSCRNVSMSSLSCLPIPFSPPHSMKAFSYRDLSGIFLAGGIGRPLRT